MSHFVPLTTNSRTDKNKISMISDPFYSWISQYVFVKNHVYKSYDNKQPITTQKILLVVQSGFIELAPIGSITESHFDKIFNTNVKGLLFTVQKALTLIQDGGSIILTASVGGSKGYEGSSVYSSTKAAIRSFARTWTVELKTRKIRVNAISPGPIHTPMTSSMVQSEELGEQLKTNLVKAVPLGRMGNPDEVAKAV
jgi:NAD(P)-dependent dehydrogenase (short-subunit alcohol dehydrogenase family)